jgi:hypothetical protein
VAKQDVTVEVFYSAAWHDRSTDARVAAGINITRGVTNPGDEATPASLSMRFQLRDGELNPRNPLSTLFGLIGTNTPIRVSVGTSKRFTGEIKSWKPGKTVDWKGPGSATGDAWMDVQASGVLGRLSRGVDTVKGALERTTLPTGPVAYWRLDDGSDAIEAGSALNDGNSLQVTGTMPTWAADNAGFPGSLPVAKVIDQITLIDEPVLTGSFPAAGGSGGFTLSVWFKATRDDTDPAHIIGVDLLHFRPPPLGLANPDPNVTIAIYSDPSDPGNDIVYSGWDGSLYASFDGGDSFDGAWHNIVVQMYQNGAGVVHSTIWLDGAMGSDGDHSSPNYTLQAINYVQVIPAQDLVFGPVSVWLGAVQVWDDVIVDPVDDIWLAGIGFPDEPADFRFVRLCDEAGIDSSIVGGLAGYTPMGPQYPSTLLGLFSEIEQTDDAQIFDARDDLELRMRPGRTLLQQDPLLTLDAQGEEIAPDPPLLPVVGDEHVRNDVVARAPNGSTGRYVQESGPNNVQAPGTDPGAVGRYETQISVNPGTINYDNEAVPQSILLRSLAGWRVAKGTFDGTWYQSLTVDLDAAPGRVADVDPVDMGDMIELTNLNPDEVPVGDVRHLAIGTVEAIGNNRRTVTFNMQPAAPFEAGILGATNQAGYLDCGGCTVNEALDATETGIDVLITDECTWTHADGDYDVFFDGERVTVTAVSAVGGTAGALTQTLTVTRSVNGVVKSHAAGVEVHVADPFVLAL